MKIPFFDILKVGEKVIDKVVPDADLKQQYKAQLLSLEQSELENSFKNIQLEITSEDKYVKRARPTFLYIIYLYLISCIPFSIAFFKNPDTGKNILNIMQIYFTSLPTELWTTFVIGYLGYSGLRTYEKYKNANEK